MAGRLFAPLWSVKGKGTRTTSPKSKPIVFCVIRVVPDPGEGVLRELHHRGSQLPLVVALPPTVDKRLALRDLVGGESPDLFDECLVGHQVHATPSDVTRIAAAAGRGDRPTWSTLSQDAARPGPIATRIGAGCRATAVASSYPHRIFCPALPWPQ